MVTARRFNKVHRKQFDKLTTGKLRGIVGKIMKFYDKIKSMRKVIPFPERRESILRVKPSSIDTSSDFVASRFNRSERELVAANIVRLCQKRDRWIPFTLEEYKESRSLGVGLETVLDDLVRDDYLTFVDGKYSITPKFIEAVKDFQVEEE